MKISTETISFTCPSCGHTTKPHAAVKELIQGRRLACEKCGTEIPIDPEAFRNVERILEKLGVDHTPFLSVDAATSVAVHCPHCSSTTTVKTSLAKLGERGKVFCRKCGKEIPIDRDKIHRAQSVVERLGDVTGNGALDTPEGPVVVKTKTFSFNVNKNIEIGKPPLPDADGPILISPGSSGRPAIEPKRGCLRVMGALVLSSVAALIYGFLG